MTTPIEAQRLSGVDRGKHVRFTGSKPLHLNYSGELVQVKHLGDGGTTIVIRTSDGRLEWDHVGPGHTVDITGMGSMPPAVPLKRFADG